MAIGWRLKTYLATKKGIFKATELQRLVIQKTGVLISLQNLCNYLNKKPCTLNLKTMELLCTALDCEIKEFFEVKPSEALKNQDSRVKKLSFKNTPHNKRALESFPDPTDYK